MQLFVCKFFNILPVIQCDVGLLIIICEIVSINLGMDFILYNCFKTKFIRFLLLFCCYFFLLNCVDVTGGIFQ